MGIKKFMAKVIPEFETQAKIKVIGIGGSGKNALNHMVDSKIKGVEFIAINTDTQDLHAAQAERKIHIGKNLTKGLGAGMDPEIGRRSAEETREEIQDAIKGADMVFIAGGMGGGTCTGAAPIVAAIAKEEGILTVGVVTKPFFFEGSQRMRLAENGLEELEKEVDALITIPNDRLLSVVDKNTTVTQAFAMCDETLKQAVEGIAEIIRLSGKMNLDFNDIRRILKDSGTALFGMGRAMGENRAVDAAQMAISNPLLDISIHGATGLLYVIYGNDDLGMLEVADASRVITESVSKDAKVIHGIYNDDTLKKDEVKVTVIATGFPTANGEPRKAKELGLRDYKSNNDQEPLARPTVSIRAEEAEQAKQAPTRDSRERIENELPERVSNKTEKTEDFVEDKKPKFIFKDDEDDDWGSLPPFLTRKKKSQ